MKKILSVILILVVMFAFSGCRNNVTNNGNTSSETRVEYNKLQIDNTKDATTEGKMRTINITVDNTTFTAALEDKDTAKAFVSQLSLMVDMSELNGNEKYNNLSSNLRADTASSPGTINEGDNNTLVLFYKTFNTSYRYIKLGHIKRYNRSCKSLRFRQR